MRATSGWTVLHRIWQREDTRLAALLAELSGQPVTIEACPAPPSRDPMDFSPAALAE